MAAMRAQKACFGQQVQSRSAIRAPAARSSVVVRAAADRKLWAPDVVAPTYLDGTLAGDYGEHKWDGVACARPTPCSSHGSWC